MDINETFAWSLHNDRLGSASSPRDRLRAAAAIVDGAFVSALIWLALLLIVH